MKLYQLLQRVENDKVEFTYRTIVDGAMIIELNDKGIFLEVEQFDNDGYALELTNFGQFDNSNINTLVFYTKNRSYAYYGSIETNDIINDYNL